MRLPSGLDAIIHRRELRRWNELIDRIDAMDPVTLAAMQQQATDLRAVLDRTIAAAERRVSSPAAGRGKPEGPSDSDWAWRPSLFRTRLPIAGHAGAASGTPLGDEAKIFHDCTTSEVSVTQRPGLGRAGAAPFVLAVDVLAFEGSFLSIAIDLPERATTGLSPSHIVHAAMTVDAERPLEMFARLNVQQGPNVEQMVNELDLSQSDVEIWFDLAYTGLVDTSVDRAWIDIIFGDPQLNRVEIGEMVLSRRLRAEL
ncbi:DUF6478 family protein [Palleronia sp.]|uniref:DUF6478 family protein n=1 Tax=Palleronia sp. TaxID=1940284 RepID=UPI0035C81BD4